MRCLYCMEEEWFKGLEVCESCYKDKLPERHRKALERRECLSSLDQFHWKKYVFDRVSWTIFCRACLEEFRVDFDFLKGRPFNQRSYCDECFENGLAKAKRNDGLYFKPIIINYNEAPGLARFLSGRDGNFPDAKKYIEEKGFANV